MPKAARKHAPLVPMTNAKIMKAEVIPIKTKTPKTEWITVTPDLAIKWLDTVNTNNRAVREDHVDRLAADMLAGKWRGRNGEPIKFDTNGRMFEGQHRCWAAIKADVSFETLMISGCDPDDYSTSGIGRPKSFADFLGPVHGEKNVNNLASGIRIIHMWLNGKLNASYRQHGRTAPTIAQLQKTLEDHPNIRDSVNYVCGLSATRKLLTPSFSILIHYSAVLSNKTAAVNSFLERIGDGLGLTDTDPVYHLRKFLLAQRAPKPGTRRAGQPYVLALVIKAWNLYKNGTPTQHVRFRADEDFPTL